MHRGGESESDHLVPGKARHFTPVTRAAPGNNDPESVTGKKPEIADAWRELAWSRLLNIHQFDEVESTVVDFVHPTGKLCLCLCTDSSPESRIWVLTPGRKLGFVRSSFPLWLSC
jgi:hypothetical protein